MKLQGHIQVSLLVFVCFLARRMWSISLAGRLSPMESFLWSLKDPPFKNTFPRVSSVGHFRTFSCAGREDQLYPDLSSGCHNYYSQVLRPRRAYKGYTGWRVQQSNKSLCWFPTIPFGPLGPGGSAKTSRCKIASPCGYYPCSIYYCTVSMTTCLGGATYSNMCSEGDLFDVKSQECRKEDDVDCPNVPPSTEKCWHQPDGFYPDYNTDCSSYYSCHNGSLIEEGRCDGNSIWDSATGSCGLGSHVICSPPSCLGQREGFYPLHGSACTAYYFCREGYRTDMLCPMGSIFDYMKKRCISGTDAVCYEGACEGRVNGLHSAPHATCSTFYRCFNGAMTQLDECPFGQIFDGRECVFRSNFSCWREGEGSCGNKPNGIYASEDNDCRSFFFCKNRQMIRSFRCDEGLVFNGKECVESHNFICNPRPPIPDCTNKFDGYYTVEKTNCKTFFRCRNGKKISEHNCPGNQVFNGQYCISPVFFSCTGKATIVDVMPNNGLYRKHKH